ncbi:MAG: metal ABC transporter substrate-binding protein [Opitutales bacterium]
MLRLLTTLIISAHLWFDGQAFAQTKPVVISSFTVIHDWVQIIGGKDFETINVIPPRSEAHGFQLSPRQAKDLRRADVIVGMSPEFEPWLAAWAKANGRSDAILWLNGHSRVQHPLNSPANPHAWTDPARVRVMVKALADRLGKLSGEDKTQVSYQQYVKEIEKVESSLGKLFDQVPLEKRAFISHHANLELFAQRYGLKVAGTILAGGSAESADPSVRHFSELLALIRKQQIRVIVTDEGQNDAFARRLTEDAGLPPPLTLSFEYLEPTGQPGDTWVSMMLTNGQRLQQALLGK